MSERISNPIADALLTQLTQAIKGSQVVDAAKKEEEQECDHKGHYRIVNGIHVAIRWCTGCGKSWRMPTQGDYVRSGQYPDAIWEEIDEPEKWASPVLAGYEE